MIYTETKQPCTFSGSFIQQQWKTQRAEDRETLQPGRTQTVPLPGLPRASLQGQDNTYKGKYSWADFRDFISNKKMMRLFCCILMGFVLIWGLQMVRIIRSCTGWYYYICRTRTYANSLIFLSWLVLSSLTLSIEGAMLVLCPVQVNSHLGVSSDVLSSHAHLFKETKPTFWVHTQHPRFPPSFQPLRKGGKKIGRRENKTKKLRHRTTW